MKKLIYLVIYFGFFVFATAFGQRGSLLLTFHATDYYTGDTLILDSVVVENPDRNCDTIVYGPNPELLIMWLTGIDENTDGDGFEVVQNYPNPFTGSTKFNIRLSDKKDIKIALSNVLGTQVAVFQKTLDRGSHTFTVETGSGGIYFLTVSNERSSKTLKLISKKSASQNKFSIVYSERENIAGDFKAGNQNRGFSFLPGDILSFTPYAYGHDNPVSQIAPVEDHITYFELKPNLLEFTASVTSDYVPLNTQFTSYSNIPGIQTWHWDFGDGDTSNLQSPSHTYQTQDTFYTVTLSATTSQGEEFINKEVDYIHALHDLSSVNFSADYEYGLAPFTVHFTGYTNIQDVWGWQWNFGDGHTVQGIQNPTHIYTEVGDYNVYLQVIAEGGTASEVKPDLIHALPHLCPLTVSDADGNTYPVVQIGRQCWMAENLNVGTYLNKQTVDGSYQTDNGVVEKYCWMNDQWYCEEYGGLYQWDEAMNYITEEGTQGICPEGWHLPTDEEWKIMEGFVDGHYGIGSSEWDKTGWRGDYLGVLLKSDDWWGNDIFGFTALPTGNGNIDNFLYFSQLFESAFFWTSKSSGSSKAWLRVLNNTDEGYRYSNRNAMYQTDAAAAVRCIKNPNK
jgi:uncharacterized protein (TIGR02145 family)